MRLSKSNSFSLRKRLPDVVSSVTPSPKRQNFILRPNISKTRTSGKVLDTTFAFSTLKVEILDPNHRTKSTPKMRRTVTKLSPKHIQREVGEMQSVPRFRGRGRPSPSKTVHLEEIKIATSGMQVTPGKVRSPKGFIVNVSPRHYKTGLPAPGKIAAKVYSQELTDYERLEILNIPEVYYIGRLDSKSQSKDFSFDDDRSDYKLSPGDHLNYRYEVGGLLGKGSFGQVVKCVDHRSRATVAVKIIRNKKRLYTQGLVEVKALQTLCENDRDDTRCIVRLWSSFTFRGHLCIVFELLCYNLYELLKSRSYVGLPLQLCRRFCHQMLTALEFTASNDIIHCDLKPENVMLSRLNSADIKLIDFGSCCFSEAQIYTYIQSRFYRAPEVIFGIRYSSQIDMWSLGCIMAELFTGLPLFPGETEQDLILLILELVGLPSPQLIQSGNRTHLFFTENGEAKIRADSKGVERLAKGKEIAEVLGCQNELFLDFVRKCLVWEPERRMTPKQGLAHIWITSRDIS